MKHGDRGMVSGLISLSIVIWNGIWDMIITVHGMASRDANFLRRTGDPSKMSVTQEFPI